MFNYFHLVKSHNISKNNLRLQFISIHFLSSNSDAFTQKHKHYRIIRRLIQKQIHIHDIKPRNYNETIRCYLIHRDVPFLFLFLRLTYEYEICLYRHI